MRLALAEVLIALVGVAGGVWCWHAGVRTFVSVAEGEPAIVTTSYSGPWLLLASLLVGAAGVLTLDAVRRAVARRHVPTGGILDR